MKVYKSVKKNKLKLFYLVILGLVFSVFIITAFLNVQIKNQVPKLDIYFNPIVYTQKEYPILQNALAPEISAQGALILDRDSLVSLFEKNSKLRFSPASTTKIMTALVALEYFSPDDILTIKQSNVEGSTLGLSLGEQLRFEDLLYAMMLPSANDATMAIADNYPGGVSAFVARMNEKAKELGLLNTFYADPVGLMDTRDYTTPTDLARLTDIALENPDFTKVVGTKSKSIKNTLGKEYIIDNLNILLDLPGVNGVKTGFTEGAGQVLVTSKKIPGYDKDIIIVVMQSLDRFGDTEVLLNYLENNITYLSIHP